MTRTTTSEDDLAGARAVRARWLRAKIAALPTIGEYGPDHSARHTIFRAAVRALGDELRALPDRPRLRDEWNGASIAMLGIRSSSTVGLSGALSNWLARVETEERRDA